VNRRDFLKGTGAAGLGAILFSGCSTTEVAVPAIPGPFHHGEFAGRIGVAREDITPPVGIYARNWGAAHHDVAKGVHRPLTVTVLSLQRTGTPEPVFLGALDLGWWKSPEDERLVRDALLRTFSVDDSRVLLNLSHTHAGPAISREDEGMPGGNLIAPYLAKVRDAVTQAAKRALETAVEGVLTWRAGRSSLAVNRDLPDPARPRMVTGFNPDAWADDTVLVGRVADRQGKILAVLVNYACHGTTLAWENELLSPDFAGALRETVEANVPGALCLYLQGPSGELAPREQYTANVAIADRNGRELAFSALSALEGMLPPETRLEYSGVVESGAPLATWKRTPRGAPTVLSAVKVEVEMALKPMPTAAELDAMLLAATDRVQGERLKRKMRIRRIVGDGTTARVPLWVWRVGDAFVVGHPNEAYSRLQTKLRHDFPDQPIVVMNLVNGSIGYLAPAELHVLDLYQVWQSPFEQGSLELLIAKAREVIVSLGGTPRVG
jgi:hypothetical protein